MSTPTFPKDGVAPFRDCSIECLRLQVDKAWAASVEANEAIQFCGAEATNFDVVPGFAPAMHSRTDETRAAPVKNPGRGVICIFQFQPAFESALKYLQ